MCVRVVSGAFLYEQLYCILGHSVGWIYSYHDILHIQVLCSDFEVNQANYKAETLVHSLIPSVIFFLFAL